MNFQGIDLLKECPQIVTLCGSSRFIELFAVMAWEFEKQGSIALGLHLLPQSYFEKKGVAIVPDHLGEVEGVQDQMDALHLAKIDMADFIYVLNVDGYIGKSTAREIAYAELIGKSIRYHEPTSEKGGIVMDMTKGMKSIVRQQERIRELNKKLRETINEEFPAGTSIWLLPQQTSKVYKIYSVIGRNYSGDLKIENVEGRERWLRSIPYLISEDRLFKASEE